VYQCYVCGWQGLLEPPRSLTGGASFETCQSCGFEEGFHDDDLGLSYSHYRDNWRAAGMRWSTSNPTPAGWDPHEQLTTLPLSEWNWEAGNLVQIMSGKQTLGCLRIEWVDPRGYALALAGEVANASARSPYGRYVQVVTIDTMLARGIWRVTDRETHEPRTGPFDTVPPTSALTVNEVLRAVRGERPWAPSFDEYLTDRA